MAVNCYVFEVPVEVCVNGPVGGGDTATLSVFIGSDPFTDLASSGQVGSDVPNWDGSPQVFTGWHTGGFGGCSTVSSTMTVTLVGDDQVEVSIEVEVDGCLDSYEGDIYSSCGDGGSHTFTDLKIVTMTGAPCPSS